MTKTLADMTAEERAECVGMWASHQGHEDKDEPCGNLGIISGIDRDYAWIAFPKESAETYVFDLEDLTPRFDLPRAWTPDGEPELAQALAEETYFYGVQVWMGGRWIMMLTSDYGTSLLHRGKWFERKDEAQACAAKWNHDTPTRIVRQRRSPVEVINE